MATEKRTNATFEKELMNSLRFGKLEKEQLSELVKAVASVQAQGLLKGVKVFPKGIPYHDGLEVHTVVDAGSISKLIDELAKLQASVGVIKLFPIGIPWPEIYQVELELGF